MKEKDENDATLRRLGSAIEREKLELKKNQGRSLLRRTKLFAVIAWALIWAFTAAIKFLPDGVASIRNKETNNTYLVDSESAKSQGFRSRIDAMALVQLKAETCRTNPMDVLANDLKIPLSDAELL